VREREGGWAGQQAVILKVRLGLGETERGTWKQNDRANNENPKQSWVAQLVLIKEKCVLNNFIDT